ncbi:MAG: methylated-DNA--[protein]-cysteine S-methyltransferase [Schwartzia sp.]|nr:methylated-DNA--[protein]-cysteine S-methyltransferase [Schwartzia sp. (in: firmicutes)]
MTYSLRYESPLGAIAVSADDEGVTELGFVGRELFAPPSGERCPALLEARRWLDIYFSGKRPDFTPSLHLTGTPFRMDVWRLLLDVPYGETTTYGALAKEVAKQRGVPRMAAQAVGGAVGHNPVAIIIPCHRVIGGDGRLVGYASGLDKKTWLLALEGAVFR